MSNRLFIPVLVVVFAVFGGGSVHAGENGPVPDYHFDPALSLREPELPAVSGEARKLVVIDKDDKATNVRLQTAVPVAPYVGAELAPEASPEERRLLEGKTGRDGLGDYKLEAGIGLYVEDRASLNLGYRFQNPPSLIDQRRNDPLTLTGDLRITFDVKIPFD